MVGFGAEEGFKAPAEIGAVPGIQAIALGGEPVVAEELPHSVECLSIIAWRSTNCLFRRPTLWRANA